MKMEKVVLFIVLLYCIAFQTSIAWLFDIPPKFVDGPGLSKRHFLGLDRDSTHHDYTPKVFNQGLKSNHQLNFNLLLWILKQWQKPELIEIRQSKDEGIMRL
ncbi:uncharacterized protein LOC130051688 [Ostrea edulis]|uniref:uncharacterized protein LOC130051688 n=1 Tax=Ostrea edulis TaxID=37623 RepID=UPI0024AFF830|nr:uncharacterized protein LOC130051688 [Ostrea edulis]